MADLRVEDAILSEAQAAFRAASDRLGTVVRVLKGLDLEVVGAPPLAENLQGTAELLEAKTGTIGQALDELAARTNEANTTFTQVDQSLSRQARAAR